MHHTEMNLIKVALNNNNSSELSILRLLKKDFYNLTIVQIEKKSEKHF